MNSRITELVGDLAERDRRRENEQREQARKRMFDTAVSVPTIYELESELRRLERNFASIKTDFYLRIALFKRYLKLSGGEGERAGHCRELREAEDHHADIRRPD